MPADTADIPNFSVFLSLLQINSSFLPRLDQEALIAFFYPIPHCQPTDRGSVLGAHLRKIRKERKQEERKERRKKERKKKERKKERK